MMKLHQVAVGQAKRRGATRSVPQSGKSDNHGTGGVWRGLRGRSGRQQPRAVREAPGDEGDTAKPWEKQNGSTAGTKVKRGPWTNDEVKTLKQVYRNASDKQVAEELFRSIHSVRAKARALGLRKTKKYLKSIGRA